MGAIPIRQTCSSPCVSMAWWFWERTQAQASAAVANGEEPLHNFAMPIDRRAFGRGPRSVNLFLLRWFEEAMAKLLEV